VVGSGDAASVDALTPVSELLRVADGLRWPAR
jgi:hypothetical protein